GKTDHRALDQQVDHVLQHPHQGQIGGRQALLAAHQRLGEHHHLGLVAGGLHPVRPARLVAGGHDAALLVAFDVNHGSPREKGPPALRRRGPSGLALDADQSMISLPESCSCCSVSDTFSSTITWSAPAVPSSPAVFTLTTVLPPSWVTCRYWL